MGVPEAVRVVVDVGDAVMEGVGVFEGVTDKVGVFEGVDDEDLVTVEVVEAAMQISDVEPAPAEGLQRRSVVQYSPYGQQPMPSEQA